MTAKAVARPTVQPATRQPDEVSFALTPFWMDNTWQLRATRDATTVFSAVAVRLSPKKWILEECLPQRRDATLAALLCQAARWLVTHASVSGIVAIHPAHWDDELVARGARSLQRINVLANVLDADYLRLHARVLPDDHYITTLRATADETDRLTQLSPASDRDGDGAVWRDVLGSCYGPLIPDASLTISTQAGPCAAIAVTQYRGRPFIGHLVTAESVRGQGLGRALLVHSLQQLHRTGWTDCRLHVVEENWIAHRLYRSVGFSRCQQTLRASYFTHEVRTDVY